MHWNIITQPSIEPITIDEAKLHCRIDGIEDDTLVGNLITASRQYCEKWQSRSYIETTIEVKYDSFGCNMVLPVLDVMSIDSIKYYDTNNELQTLSSSIYELDNNTIIASYNQSFPLTRGFSNSVIVTYKAGYGDAASDVPNITKQAIYLMIGHLYENREATSSLTVETIPFGVASLLSMDTRNV